MAKTGSWIWRAGVLVGAAVLSAGCTAGTRAANTTPPAPARADSGATPAAGAPTAVPAVPPPSPAAGAGSGAAGAQSSPDSTTQDQTAETQDDAAIAQDLAQLNTELSTADQASGQGENDVPSN
ncbi:MAG TPA: hypothetical protein VFW71_02230 [Actinomycetota bacterium]|nr:hypothetical protein [Actinomycetota bacterium]